jgi:hypothetical protein
MKKHLIDSDLPLADISKRWPVKKYPLRSLANLPRGA